MNCLSDGLLRLLVRHFACGICMAASCADAILAGGEFSLPDDSPSSRLDAEGLYSFVGSLDISASGYSYRGSAVSAFVALGAYTTGHNVDFNDDGAVDGELSIDFSTTSPCSILRNRCPIFCSRTVQRISYHDWGRKFDLLSQA